MKEPLGKYIAENVPNGFLMISCGLPGTGKSTALDAVQKIKGGGMLKSDLIRRDVLKGQDIFDVKVAGDMNQRTKVYDILFRQARELLEREFNFYLDATFITQELRRQAAAIASRCRKSFIILETVCPEEVCLGRIKGRHISTSVSNAVTEDAYRDNQKRYEPVDLADLKKLFPSLPVQHIVVDTGAEKPYVVSNTIKR